MQFNQSRYQYDPKGLPLPRVWAYKAKGKKSPRLLIRCGDCQNKIEIHYSNEDLEINGVLAGKDQWRKIFKKAGLYK